MEISLEGTISRESREKAKNGEIYPHIVCGVEVYVAPEYAKSEGIDIDDSRPIPRGLHRDLCPHFINPTPEMYFSDRHYRIIDVRDDADYLPCGTVEEVRQVMIDKGAEGARLLKEEVLEQDDGDTAYVLTPLDDIEMAVLMDPGPQKSL